MSTDDLTPEQAKAIDAALRPALGYLHRLRERMIKTGFLPDDKLFALVSNAYGAMHQLGVTLHYAACGGAWDGAPPETTP